MRSTPKSMCAILHRPRFPVLAMVADDSDMAEHGMTTSRREPIARGADHAPLGGGRVSKEATMMHTQRWVRTVAVAAVVALVGALVLPTVSYAKSAQQIDAGVNAALVKFRQQVQGASTFLQDAQGVLVFPGVVQAGLGIGGEFGEGALRIRGSTVRYYTIGAASVGFQWGAQMK